MDQNDLITVTMRSFLFPDETLEGFILGEYIGIDLPAGTTLEEFTGRFFFRKLNRIGVMAVNGKLASMDTALMPGDAIDLYPLLEGG